MFSDEQLIAWMGAALATPVLFMLSYRVWRIAGNVSFQFVTLLSLQMLVCGAMIILPMSRVYDTSIISVSIPIIIFMHMLMNRAVYIDRVKSGWKPRPLMGTLLIGFLLAFTDTVYSWATVNYGSPVVVKSATPVKSAVHVGEPAEIEYLLERRRLCPARIYGAWYHPDGDVALRLQPYDFLGYEIGYQNRTVTRETKGLKPGTYYYMSTGIYRCNGSESIVGGVPVWIKIVDRSNAIK